MYSKKIHLVYEIACIMRRLNTAGLSNHRAYQVWPILRTRVP